MLLKERKLSEKVRTVLQALNLAITNGSVGDDLVSAVKECGLSRDISKHEVTIEI